ncbi:hypothetical protein ACLKMH_02570 [Psychromonas sp. KJ10-10]|uniref:hypothetical protein n=1 Tax=Psychromonas sp. KJ10-10 TaxID=3391823 RepID=UPI0039B533F4
MAVPAVSLITGCASTETAKDAAPKVMSSPVASVNFDSLTAGTQIDVADPTWSVEKVNGSTLVAEVSANMSKSAPNSLYLFDDSSADKPYALLKFAKGAATSGSVSFDAYIPSQNPKTVYVNFGVGKNNSQRFFELRLNAKDGIVQYENGSKDVKVADFTADQWHTYTATWVDGSFSIAIDGVASPTATNISVASTGLSASNTPTTVTFYAGDKKSTGTSAYIDNIESTLFK